MDVDCTVPNTLGVSIKGESSRYELQELLEVRITCTDGSDQVSELQFNIHRLDSQNLIHVACMGQSLMPIFHNIIMLCLYRLKCWSTVVLSQEMWLLIISVHQEFNLDGRVLLVDAFILNIFNSHLKLLL